ncbi:2-succinylbenzoate--CoA ligase, chloroplastic/peroxisomal [Dorcoceras hygrometricum]|uniref:2-succinylbenzoate--CoA ligase, chloroplastic/peroxisomal n=1 Tax=Dorcoceras hygrometricum TaxID=472368 RepID=A0A2Z6ZZC6_9LAMI|nr:2-succinylbenzoate--CoA ligase, chloroplastic/peroxisomal [Dorcoceras hygrometricum]
MTINIDSVPSLRIEMACVDGRDVKPVEYDHIFFYHRTCVGTKGCLKGAIIAHSALVVQSLAKRAIVQYGDDDVRHFLGDFMSETVISKALASNFKMKFVPICTVIHCATSEEYHRPYGHQTLGSFESVKKIFNGGCGLSPQLLKDVNQNFARATILSAYGMTEACSSLTFTTLKDLTKESHHQKRNDVKNSIVNAQGGVCVGKPAPHTELKVCLEEAPCPGRIFMRGPHAMLHYWGQSKNLNLVHQGWIEQEL